METMKDLTKYFIDLRKCSEEQRKHIFSLLPEPVKSGDFIINEYHSYLHFNSTLSYPRWYVGYEHYNKSELTYPEFIKLFEGGEGENGGWIKIESESDLPKEVGDYWAVWKDGEVGKKQFFCSTEKNIYSPNGNISEYDWWMRHITHYQPIVKPEPPKF